MAFAKNRSKCNLRKVPIRITKNLAKVIQLNGLHLLKNLPKVSTL